MYIAQETPMSLLIFCLVVLIVCGLLVYAVRVLGIGEPFERLIIVLIVVIAALAIIQRAGLL